MHLAKFPRVRRTLISGLAVSVVCLLPTIAREVDASASEHSRRTRTLHAREAVWEAVLAVASQLGPIVVAVQEKELEAIPYRFVYRGDELTAYWVTCETYQKSRSGMNYILDCEHAADLSPAAISGRLDDVLGRIITQAGVNEGSTGWRWLNP